MVDYRGWRIALPRADVAIGLRHRLVAVSQALGPPAHPRQGLAAGEHARNRLRSRRARADCARPRDRYPFPTVSSSYKLPRPDARSADQRVTQRCEGTTDTLLRRVQCMAVASP